MGPLERLFALGLTIFKLFRIYSPYLRAIEAKVGFVTMLGKMTGFFFLSLGSMAMAFTSRTLGGLWKSKGWNLASMSFLLEVDPETDLTGLLPLLFNFLRYSCLLFHFSKSLSNSSNLVSPMHLEQGLITVTKGLGCTKAMIATAAEVDFRKSMLD